MPAELERTIFGEEHGAFRRSVWLALLTQDKEQQ
jgi:hypothetical protein